MEGGRPFFSPVQDELAPHCVPYCDNFIVPRAGVRSTEPSQANEILIEGKRR